MVDMKVAGVATNSNVQVTSGFPLQKVTYGLIAGALTTIIVWVLKTYFKVDVPSEVAGAVTTLLTVLVAYITPLKQNEIVTPSAQR